MSRRVPVIGDVTRWMLLTVASERRAHNRIYARRAEVCLEDGKQIVRTMYSGPVYGTFPPVITS